MGVWDGGRRMDTSLSHISVCNVSLGYREERKETKLR